MKLPPVTILALAIAFACTIGGSDAAAEEQNKARWAAGVGRVTAHVAAPVYDGRGGSKIGYLAPGVSYFLIESRRQGVRDLWHLLVAAGGAHVGWIWSLDGINSLQASCPRALPPVDFSLELLYGAPKRKQ